MDSRLGLYRIFLIAIGSLLLCSKVAAQSTDASCALSSLEWAFNSHQESPCVVASSLIGVCYGGTYNVPSLPEQNHYLGPAIDDSNPCQCNTVVYSLMSACGLCQNRTISRWNEWSSNCASVYTNYPEPIPSGTFVPGWAYLDVKSQGVFNADLAKQDANATESSAVPLPTSTSTSSTSSSTTSQATSSSPSPTSISNNDVSAEEDRQNKIGGGIVGGVLGLSGLCVLFVWLRSRRNRRHDEPPSTTVTEESKNSEALPTVVVSAVPYASTVTTSPV